MENTFAGPVLIVDDHAMFRDALAMLLEHKLDCQVTTLGDLEQVLVTAQSLQPSHILMDYHLPSGDALVTAKQLKHKLPGSKLLFLTAAQSLEVLQQLVNSPADGVLHKESKPEEIVNALIMTQASQRVLSPIIEEKLSKADSALTEREFQLFRLLAQGYANKKIAEELCISTRTVEKHRENLFKKTEVSNIAQLIELGYKWGILDLEAGN